MGTVLAIVTAGGGVGSSGGCELCLVWMPGHSSFPSQQDRSWLGTSSEVHPTVTVEKLELQKRAPGWKEPRERSGSQR